MADFPPVPRPPVPEGLQPGNQPSETAIPRMISAATDVAKQTGAALAQPFPGAFDIPEHVGDARKALRYAPTFAKNIGEQGVMPADRQMRSDLNLPQRGRSLEDVADQGQSMITGTSLRDVSKNFQEGDVAGGLTKLGIGLGTAAALHTMHESPTRLVMEHPGAAQEIVDHHIMHGGSTFDPRTGKNLAGQKLWATGVAPEATAISERAPSAEEIAGFVGTHRDVLTRNPNLHVGTWYDPETNLHHTDLVATTPSKDAALNMGRQLGEKGIFHLGRNEYVPTGHEGDRPPALSSLDGRTQEIRASEPPKEPFLGTHYSNQKLDYIDGSRRGTQPEVKAGQAALPAGQEAQRLRLGGVGPDAPDGFYVYKAGSRPEPQIAGRKYAYQVRNNFAMASIDDPKWQSAFDQAAQEAQAKGANDTQAMYAGTNAKELAIRDAGYDGYTSSNAGGIHFIFDGHEAELPGAAPKPMAPSTAALTAQKQSVAQNPPKEGVSLPEAAPPPVQPAISNAAPPPPVQSLSPKEALRTNNGDPLGLQTSRDKQRQAAAKQRK